MADASAITATATSAIASWETIIGLGGIFATLFIAVHNSKRSGITDQRLEWHQKMKEYASTILSYEVYRGWYQIHATGYKELSSEEYQQHIDDYRAALKDAYGFYINLNVKGPFDRVVTNYLVEYMKACQDRVRSACSKTSPKDGDITPQKRRMCLALQIYLKVEWERIKWENRFFKCPFTISLARKGNRACAFFVWGFDITGYTLKILDSFNKDNQHSQDIRDLYMKFLDQSETIEPKFFHEIEMIFGRH